jgi:hypothetical protein
MNGLYAQGGLELFIEEIYIVNLLSLLVHYHFGILMSDG